MTELINLTAHPITDITTGQEIPTSGIVARVKATTVKVAEHNGIPVYSSRVKGIEGLPEPKDGTIYIVSSLALRGVTGREDVVSPGNLCRDQDGKPVGCTGFRRE